MKRIGIVTVLICGLVGVACADGVPNPRQFGACSRRTFLTISEIHYHPTNRLDGVNLEFIELYNSEPISHDISGYRISAEVDYTFPEGTVIPGRTNVVVAADPAAITSVSPGAAVYGPYVGALSNGGGRIRVRNHLDAVLLEVEYDDAMPWPIAADGAGHSLVLAKPDYGENNVRAWSQSELVGGSPGYASPESTGALEQLQINEFLAHTDDPQVDFIEIHNYGSLASDATGCILTDNAATNKYVITNGVIAANGFMAFDQTQLGFSLSMAYGDIYLIRPDGKRVLDAVRYEAQSNGVSMARYPDGAGEFHPVTATTPGAANASADLLVEDVVINELMYHPISGDDDDEYIELYNKGTTAANLSNWRFTDGVSYVFPEGTSIPVGGYLVVGRNVTNLHVRYSQLNVANCMGDYSGQLSDRGERVALSRPDDPALPNQDFVVVDEVTYGDGNRWGRWADGGGSSLELIDARSDNRWAMNWAGSDETQKAPWTLVEHTGVLDNGQDTAVELQILLETQGECLVDSVETFRVGQANLVANGTFESGVDGWVIQGTHILSGLETSEGYASAQSLHLVNTLKGDNGVNRVETDLTSALLSGQTATIKARVRWLAGSRHILLRYSNYWLEAPGTLDVPSDLGSPGEENSRYAANTGPAIRDVTHFPVLPAANDPVTVTARVQDPDGVQTLSVKWRDDPSTTVQSVTMSDNGTGADAIAGDGVFSAQIPGQPANDNIAFYIEADDGSAAITRFPDDAPTRECVIFFGQTPVLASTFGVYRFWVTDAVVSEWDTRELYSDHPLNATFVYGDFRVVYEASGRFRGSPFLRKDVHENRDDDAPFEALYTSYVFYMPKDDRVLGARSFNMDKLEDGDGYDDDTKQREKLALWMASEIDTPFFNQRYTHLFFNDYAKTLYGDSQQPNADHMQSWWSDADDGDLHKIDDSFFFTDGVDPGGDWDGIVTEAGSDPAQMVQYLTTGGAKKKGRYRWSWRKESVKTFDDDYSNLFSMVDAQNLDHTGPEYAAQVPALVDWDEWMQVFALRHMLADWDSYGYEKGKNMSIYKPDGDRWRMIMWDIDHSPFANSHWSSNPYSDNLFNINCPTMKNKFFQHPLFLRAYWRHLWELAYGPMEAANCGPIIDETEAAIIAEDFASTGTATLKAWIADRRTYLISKLNTVAATFAITTSGGGNFSTTDQIVTLTGTAPVEVAKILVNGLEQELTFTSVTAWQMDVPLVPGANVFSLQGYLSSGASNGTDSITITYNGSAVSPVGKLVINEIMYNAIDPYGDYVELHNVSSDRVHLGGLRLNGVDFTFGQGTFIEPNDFVVVAESLSEYQEAYGNAEKVAGEYFGSLDNGGETISLLMPVSSNVWTELDRVRYDDLAPWPTDADGLGPSLQLVDALQDNARVANWRGSLAQSELYTPGAANSVAATLSRFPEVWINELMVENAFAQDGQGDYDPWLELLSAESGTVDLSTGYYLTDTYTNLTRWAFPSGWTMETGDYQVVWADGETNDTTVSELHAGIALSSPSGMVALAWYNGAETIVLDYINYDTIPSNTSYGFYPDGPGEGYDRQVFHNPTPGTDNNPTSVVVNVRINEWMARNSSTIADPADDEFQDWFELYNAGDATANLSGYTLTDKLLTPDKFRVPVGTLLDAGEYMLVWADNEPEQNGAGVELHVNFSLGGDGEAIGLFAPDGSAMDTVTFSTQITDVAEGRWPDGSEIWDGGLEVPTPRESNVLSGGPPEVMRGLPFEEDFESYAAGDSLDTQDPDGFHPWVATNVVVTDNPVQTGDRAAALTSQTAVATQTFTDGQTNVWTDFYLQPVFGDNSSVEPPPGSSFACYVRTNGQVVAYSGTNQTELSHAQLIEGEWVRFTVHSDYGTKKWDLYLNGNPTPIGSGLGFFDTGAASYTEFGVLGAVSNAAVDSIRIDTNTLIVGGPWITVSRTGIPVSAVVGQDAASEQFQVWNSGTNTLDYTFSGEMSGLSISPTFGSSTGTADKITHTITFTTAGLAAGQHDRTISVVDAGASNSPVVIPVTITMTPAPTPSIALSTNALSTSAFVGENASDAVFQVWNSGGSTLDYTFSGETNGLSIDPTFGSSTGTADKVTHTITFTTAGLAAGQHDREISVDAAGASNSPVVIPVTITMTPAPTPSIALSTNALSTTAFVGENAPGAMFQVWNSGVDTLTYTFSGYTNEWLSISQESGSSTGTADKKTHTITFTTDTLSEGEYNTTISVVDEAASNSPEGLSVTITMIPSHPLPFVEDFEDYDPESGLAGQDPDGFHPWTATNAVVTTNTWWGAGSQAAALTGQTAVATQTFTDGQTNVWTDLYIQPVFGAVANPPSGVSVAFYVHANGQVMAFDSTTETQLVHTALDKGQWVRFTVHSDYAAKQWDLYLDGDPTPIGSGLGFFDTNAASYTKFQVQGAGAVSNAAVDSIRIDTNAPSDWNSIMPHGADYKHLNGTPGADWKIDAIEAGRILVYLRAGQYFNVPVTPTFPDGYSHLSGTQTNQHPADYQVNEYTPGADWLIDADEANRILIYFRAGEYHQVPVSAAYPDGYAPGAP